MANILNRTIFGLVFVVALSMIFFSSHEEALAQPEARCPKKVLDSGKIEGIFMGVECGDYCHATFKLDSGEVVDYLCDEENAEKYFGEKGNKVSVDYELLQYWDQDPESGEGNCSRYEFVKSGRILAKGEGLDILKQEEARKNQEYQEAERRAQEAIKQATQSNKPKGCPVQVKIMQSLNKRKLDILHITAVADSVTLKNIVMNRGNCKVFYKKQPTHEEYLRQIDDEINKAERNLKNQRQEIAENRYVQHEGYQQTLAEGEKGIIEGIAQLKKMKNMKYEDNTWLFDKDAFPTKLKYGETREIEYHCPEVLEIEIETSEGTYKFGGQ